MGGFAAALTDDIVLQKKFKIAARQ